MADKEGVKVFHADIIYHLEDRFLKYRYFCNFFSYFVVNYFFKIKFREELRLKRRKEHEHLAIYPCKLRVLPQNIFNARNPIVIGVSIEAGHVKKGTPICAKTSEGVLFIMSIISIVKKF